MTNRNIIIILVAVVAAALYAGYWYGDKQGYDRGFSDAVQAQAGEQAGAPVDTGYENPFEGVQFNPFK